MRQPPSGLFSQFGVRKAPCQSSDNFRCCLLSYLLPQLSVCICWCWLQLQCLSVLLLDSLHLPPPAAGGAAKQAALSHPRGRPKGMRL
jgi:hypothetical protein